jgi:hypothetical protein
MREGREELAAEANAKVIDELRVESIGMTQRNNLTANIEIIGRSKANAVLRERRPSPRHSIIAVLARTVQPLSKILTFASLMVNLNRKIDRILAAPDPTLEVVAYTVAATRRQGTATQSVDMVGRGK